LGHASDAVVLHALQLQAQLLAHGAAATVAGHDATLRYLGHFSLASIGHRLQ
jgi:hypothetical protein